MSSTPQLAFRRALFERLGGDAALTALLGAGRIFEKPPRGQDYPFMVLDSYTAEPLLTYPQEGFVHRLGLAVFSREPSRDEVLSVMDRAVTLLMETPPLLTGHWLTGLQVSGMRSRLLRDGRTFRADWTVRAVTEPAA